MQLNYFQIKILAIVAMTLGHIAGVWVETGSTLGQSLHFFGRITAPLMSFLLVEGFFRVKQYPRYVIRLGVFAVLAQVPFVAMLKGLEQTWLNPSLLFFKLNVLFNLLFALLSLGVFYKTQLHLIVKITLLVFLLFCSIKTDWGCSLLLLL